MSMINETEVKYHNILRQANRHTFSQKEAAIWVGGLIRLKSLIVEGKIRFGEGSKPTAWRLNASDVLRNCRCDLLYQVNALNIKDIMISDINNKTYIYMSKSTIRDDDLISLALKVPYQYLWNIEDLIDKANSSYAKEKMRWIMRKKELLEQIKAN